MYLPPESYWWRTPERSASVLYLFRISSFVYLIIPTSLDDCTSHYKTKNKIFQAPNTSIHCWETNLRFQLGRPDRHDLTRICQFSVGVAYSIPVDKFCVYAYSPSFSQIKQSNNPTLISAPQTMSTGQKHVLV